MTAIDAPPASRISRGLGSGIGAGKLPCKARRLVSGLSAEKLEAKLPWNVLFDCGTTRKYASGPNADASCPPVIFTFRSKTFAFRDDSAPCPWASKAVGVPSRSNPR